MLFLDLNFDNLSCTKSLDLQRPVRPFEKHNPQPPKNETNSTNSNVDLQTILSDSNVFISAPTIGNPPPNSDPTPPPTFPPLVTTQAAIHLLHNNKIRHLLLLLLLSQILANNFFSTTLYYCTFYSSTQHCQTSIYFSAPFSHPPLSAIHNPPPSRPNLKNPPFSPTAYDPNAFLHPGLHNYPQPSFPPPLPHIPLPSSTSTRPIPSDIKQLSQHLFPTIP